MIVDFSKLVRRANQRLLALEKLSGQKGFEAVTEYAYKAAQRDIKALGLSGNRFSRRILSNKSDMRKAYNAVQRFLDTPTSGSARAQKVIGKLQRERQNIVEQLKSGESVTFTKQYSRGLNKIFSDSNNLDMLKRFLGV
jgi:hypothetical protein